MTLIEAIEDENLFAGWFSDRETWRAWTVVIKALFGLPLVGDELTTFRTFTGRGEAPTVAATEAWLIVGRRGGKSFVMSLIGVFLAAFRNYEANLAPGERATVLILAADRKQARVCLRYIGAMLTKIALLRSMVVRETADSFDLRNGVTIEVGTASHRSTRGYTYCAVLADEIAFWATDGAAEPDYAVLDAVRPAMATIPGAMLLCASSPYARRGALWDAHRRHFGKDGDPILVWKAPTRAMNPAVPQSVIDTAIERDPAVASAEYLAEFRSDLEAFVSREVVEACISPGVRERPPVANVRYAGFVDPSGGSADAMTLAIAHREGDAVVLDATRERKPPFSPEVVVAEFADLLRSYGLSTVRGDRYAGIWPREAFQRHGIQYLIADAVRSDLYLATLPVLNSKRIDLLDDPKIVAQFVGLERRSGRGGKDTIDHAPGAHDDLVNAVAGVNFGLITKATRPVAIVGPIIVTASQLGPHQGSVISPRAAFGGRAARDAFDHPELWRHG